MPEISRFYGIRITMNYDEHLPPHFHATYGDDEALVLIATGQLLKGSLTSRAASLVREWSCSTVKSWKPIGGCAMP
jgi:hypothetical protein